MLVFTSDASPSKASKAFCSADEEFVEINGHVLKFDDGEGPFFDDLTKQELSDLLVNAARRKELEYSKSKGV